MSLSLCGPEHRPQAESPSNKARPRPGDYNETASYHGDLLHSDHSAVDHVVFFPFMKRHVSPIGQTVKQAYNSYYKPQNENSMTDNLQSFNSGQTPLTSSNSVGYSAWPTLEPGRHVFLPQLLLLTRNPRNQVPLKSVRSAAFAAALACDKASSSLRRLEEAGLW